MGLRGFHGVSAAVVTSFILSSCAQAQLARTPAATNPANEWSIIPHPSAGALSSIGFYSEGCISGAKTLALDGTGYQVMRTVRNRHYGHQDLIEFIQNLGVQLNAVGSALLIGDLGMPRGGPMPFGHASHQMGLDVDIWYWTHPEQKIRSLSDAERNSLPMPSFLNANGLVDQTQFTSETITKLKLAALSPKVERIFVNPAIKTYLCSILPLSERAWLHALRPWPGHDDHFHVRLACPAGGTQCTPQLAQEAGDGCQELMPNRLNLNDFQWQDFHSLPLEPKIEKLLSETSVPKLPTACEAVRKAPAQTVSE